MMRSTFVLAALLAGPVSASALPITWTLQDVRFADGGTASGSVTLDRDRTGRFGGLLWHIRSSDVTISAEGGTNPAFPDHLYGGGTPVSASYVPFDVVTSGSHGVLSFADGRHPGSTERALFLHLAAGLTDAGGIVPLLLGDGPAHSSERAGTGLQEHERLVVSGSLVGTPASIPEPSTLAMLILGCGALAHRRRRQ